MKTKQIYLKSRVILTLVVGSCLMLVGAITTVSTTSAAGLTTWQTFIEKKCSGTTPDAAEQCSNNLTSKLKNKCGAPERSDTYTACWRKFIQNNGGTAGASSSPFEKETPTETGGTGNTCGGVDTAIISCDANNSGGIETNGVWALLLMVINILTAGIGIAAVGGIIYGSIMYTSAGDNDGQVKQAKEIIRNVIVGIILYVSMYALIQFIIPGGVFSS